MSESLGSIILIEDDLEFAETAMRILQSVGYQVDHADRIDEGLKMLRKNRYDLVLSDIHLPDGSGLTLLKKVRNLEPLIPVVLATASGSTELAVEATLHGAFDYLTKPVNRAELMDTVEKALACRQMSNDKVALPDAQEDGPRRIIGNSPPMIRLFKEIGRIARQPVPVLLLGETGTGKEMIARALYQYSGLVHKPFVPINCAAIPENLLESELFGHERGAFTGAQTRRIGRFQQADGGMVFLDEIGDLPMSMQAKLLRFLQEKEIQPLGSTEVRKVNVRVIAATHRNLEEEIQAKRFREDLYFRLNLATLILPPLRDRREDIPALIQYFLAYHSRESEVPPPSIQPAAVAFFQDRDWPGNIRELENVVRKAMLLTVSGQITLTQARAALEKVPYQIAPRSSSLAGFVDQYLQNNAENEPSGLPLLQTMEREAIDQVLQKTQGNKSRASQILGINRKTLREKMVLYGIGSDSTE